MHGYEDRRRWADRFIEDQRRTLAATLGGRPDEYRIADDADDWNGTDIIGPDGRRIALRVRDAATLADHPDRRLDVSVRLTHGRDGRNELAKIRDGKIDLMLYGFGHVDGGTMTTWNLFDLSVFRAALTAGLQDVRYEAHAAADGSRFMAYRIDDFASFGPFIIARDDGRTAA